MNVEVHHLRAVLAVAEELNFTRAANRLGMPQPSLSAQISRLERTLGAPLFIRNTRRVVLTDMARRLLPHARAVDKVMHAAERAILTGLPPQPTPLRIGTQWAVLTRLIDGLHELFEGVRIQHSVLEGEWDEAVVQRGELDLVQAYELPGSPSAVPANFRVATIVDEPVWVALPQGHPLSNHHPVNLADLAREAWLAAPAGTTHHHFLVTVCRSAGFEPDIHFLADSRSAMIDLLLTGRCVGLVSPVIAAAGSDNRRLRIRPLDIDTTRSLVLAWNPSTCPAPIARALLTSIRVWYRDLAKENPEYWANVTDSPHRYRHLHDIGGDSDEPLEPVIGRVG